VTDLRIAHRSAVVDLDGTPHRVRRGRTLAVAEHPIVVEHPELWRPLVVDYDVDPDQPPAAAGPAPTGDDDNADASAARPPVNASKADWQAYALTLGFADDFVNESTKADLIAHIDGLEADKGE
jgi:hypothetical protein